MLLKKRKTEEFHFTPEQEACLAKCRELTNDELRILNGGGERRGKMRFDKTDKDDKKNNEKSKGDCSQLSSNSSTPLESSVDSSLKSNSNISSESASSGNLENSCTHPNDGTTNQKKNRRYNIRTVADNYA